MTNYFDMVA